MNANRFALLALVLPWLLAWATTTAAAERIEAYDVRIDVAADGSLVVTEHIRVYAEGDRIRRGLYRDFPTRYRDRHGNRVVVGFEVLEVLRDGRPEPWFTERRGNGVRVNTGNDDFLPVPATYSYVLRYRTTRQLGFFDAHDELYFNAIGTGWVFPVLAGSVEVRLPQAVPPETMQAEAYTGPQGAGGRDYVVQLPEPGLAHWRASRPLEPGEGLTVVLAFPKGIVAEPDAAQRLRWLLADNRGPLVAACGLLVLLAWCLVRWWQVGRDPGPGTVVVRYTPPDGISPAGLRYVRRMGYDTRCFTADVLALAVDGALGIERDRDDDWTLRRGGGAPTGDERTALLGALFEQGSPVALDQSNAVRLQGAVRRHADALARRFKGTMFRNHGGSSAIALLIAMASATFALWAGRGDALPLTLLLIAPMAVVVVGFFVLVRAPTPEGRRLLDEIEGLRRYLGVAERQDLQRLPGPGDAAPPLDAHRFEQLLPYAVALDVEQAWTEKFTRAVGAAAAAAATASIAWFKGGRAGINDVGSFTSALGKGLTSQIASSSTPPGSGAGGGGGGFSGGGGGGGGGGGR